MKFSALVIWVQPNVIVVLVLEFSTKLVGATGNVAMTTLLESTDFTPDTVAFTVNVYCLPGCNPYIAV
jgi:hypothetical protein